MKVHVALSARVQVSGLDREQLAIVFHRMGDVLNDLELQVPDVLDHAVSVDLGQNSIEIDVTAAGKNEVEADLAARVAVVIAMLQTGGRPSGGAEAITAWLKTGNRPTDSVIFNEVDDEFESAGVEVVSRELVPV